MIATEKRSEPVLQVSGVTLGYPGVIALSNVSFEVQKGEYVGIIGPNGSGKSTLLKGILGLLKVYSGTIRCNGYSQTQLKLFRKNMGYVPQKSKNDLQFPALVREVVLMGLYAQIGWFRHPQKIHRQMALESLRAVGMADFSERSIGDLSGGQQQRVLIARALVANPQILMLDEPTASVDLYAQSAILESLEKLNKERQITILMVSHDINEIVHSCHKILLLNGQRSQFGTPREVLTKERLRTIYGSRIYVHDHQGHPHILVGDFDE